MIAYHFVGKTLRDGSPIPKNGEWLTFDGDVAICKSGLHASVDPFDALQYAPGTTLCKVKVEDVVAERADKLVCRRRKIIGRIDATELLRYFARMQALSVVHLWDAPQLVLDFLMTGDESIRAAARDAAWAVAWAAASAVASAVARAAAMSAVASAVARAAAMDAARDAASAVARDAASAVASDAARKMFNELVAEADWQ